MDADLAEIDLELEDDDRTTSRFGRIKVRDGIAAMGSIVGCG